MTGDELDEAIASLRKIGGVYDALAEIVEQENRPHVSDPVVCVCGHPVGRHAVNEDDRQGGCLHCRCLLEPGDVVDVLRLGGGHV